MTEMEMEARPELETAIEEVDNSWKTKLLIVGGVTGALIGLGTAFLLMRSSEERTGGPPEISTGDALKLGVGIIGMVRGIAALGN